MDNKKNNINQEELISKIKRETLNEYIPLPNNILYETTSYMPLEEALDETYIRFAPFKDSEKSIFQALSVLSKLYLRVFNVNSPKEMIYASNDALEATLSTFFNTKIEERFYYLGQELRKIELIEVPLHPSEDEPLKILLQIKRKNVYMPTEYITDSRSNLILKLKREDDA